MVPFWVEEKLCRERLVEVMQPRGLGMKKKKEKEKKAHTFVFMCRGRVHTFKNAHVSKDTTINTGPLTNLLFPKKSYKGTLPEPSDWSPG